MSASMAEGLRVAALGLTTVFFILIILIVILQFFKLFAKTGKAVPKAAVTPSVQKTEEVQVAKHASDDLELIAVLTAAINAYEGSTSGGGKLVVRSFRRINGQNRAWK